MKLKDYIKNKESASLFVTIYPSLQTNKELKLSELYINGSIYSEHNLNDNVVFNCNEDISSLINSQVVCLLLYGSRLFSRWQLTRSLKSGSVADYILGGVEGLEVGSGLWWSSINVYADILLSKSDKEEFISIITSSVKVLSKIQELSNVKVGINKVETLLEELDGIAGGHVVIDRTKKNDYYLDLDISFAKKYITLEEVFDLYITHSEKSVVSIPVWDMVITDYGNVDGYLCLTFEYKKGDNENVSISVRYKYDAENGTYTQVDAKFDKTIYGVARLSSKEEVVEHINWIVAELNSWLGADKVTKWDKKETNEVLGWVQLHNEDPLGLLRMFSSDDVTEGEKLNGTYIPVYDLSCFKRYRKESQIVQTLTGGESLALVAVPDEKGDYLRYIGDMSGEVLTPPSYFPIGRVVMQLEHFWQEAEAEYSKEKNPYYLGKLDAFDLAQQIVEQKDSGWLTPAIAPMDKEILVTFSNGKIAVVTKREKGGEEYYVNNIEESMTYKLKDIVSWQPLPNVVKTES